MNKFILPIGDWSNDGHGKYENFEVKVNKEKEELIEAYRIAEEKLGMTFNTNDRSDKVTLLADYEDSSIPMSAITKMVEFGVDMDKVLSDDIFNENDDFVYFTPNDTATLFMEFIKTALPDMEYEMIEDDNSYLFGRWGDLNIQVGYGTFY